MINKLLPFLGFVSLVLVLFWQFFLKGFLPIPSDTIVGLYHPYRDFYEKNYKNGIPFKNFLITDPIREQYPWKKLTLDGLKKVEIPLWNPYSFSGTPNLANFQSGAFYPLNILFILPFNLGWSIFIMLQPLLAGFFMYLFLRNLKLGYMPAFFGGMVFAFSGFFTTWLEWGNVLHTALWLPLILLSIDKLSNKKNWFFVLTFSLASAFFAGHLQTFFYLILVSIFYFILRFRQTKNIRFLTLFGSSLFLSLILVLPQLIPTLKFITLSARQSDQFVWQQSGWFIPWQHLIQLVIPDFFGNPATLNYWGVWNYGELVSYVGIIPLIFVFFAVFKRREKEVIFFEVVLLLSLAFSLPTIVAKIPYLLNIPFLSTSQPTRLIFLIDISLAILAAFGLDKFMKTKTIKEILIPMGLVAFLFFLIFLTTWSNVFRIEPTDLAVAKRNIIFPLSIFIFSFVLLISYFKLNKKFGKYVIFLFIVITIIDLFRFSWKFNAFSNKDYLYPTTKSISFLQKNLGNFRIATADARIFPPNFSVVYKIPSVEGYDPLFLNNYAELISSINRNRPDIAPPFGFNRIVRVENLDPKFLSLLGVKYILSLTDLRSLGFEQVFEEGQTKIFENNNAVPKIFLAKKLEYAKNKQEAINLIFDDNFDPKRTTIVENAPSLRINGNGSAKLKSYNNNKVEISTETKSQEFLILSDIFYPSWKAKLESGGELPIYKTNYIYRGVVVPPGKNTIIFYNNLL